MLLHHTPGGSVRKKKNFRRGPLRKSAEHPFEWIRWPFRTPVFGSSRATIDGSLSLSIVPIQAEGLEASGRNGTDEKGITRSIRTKWFPKRDFFFVYNWLRERERPMCDICAQSHGVWPKPEEDFDFFPLLGRYVDKPKKRTAAFNYNSAVWVTYIQLCLVFRLMLCQLLSAGKKNR